MIAAAEALATLRTWAYEHLADLERDGGAAAGPNPRKVTAMTTEQQAGRIVRGVMAAHLVRTARDLHGPPYDPEYTRGQVELICNATGLGTDDYRQDVEAFITGKTTDEEFGMTLARAVFT